MGSKFRKKKKREREESDNIKQLSSSRDSLKKAEEETFTQPVSQVKADVGSGTAPRCWAVSSSLRSTGM